jgi:hypothetical protein
LQQFRRQIASQTVAVAFAICKLGKQLGFERRLTGGFAVGPHAWLGHILLRGPVDALRMLYIESQEVEIFALREPGAGLGERFVDGKLGGVIPVRRGEGAESAESKDARFEGTGGFEAPVVFGDGLLQIEFQCAHGFEGFADAGAVWVERLVLLPCEKADLAGQAVTIGVEARVMLAFFGRDAGG